MKEKVYLRIAKTKSGGFIYKIDKKKINGALESTGYNDNYYPTIIVSLNIEVPDKFFDEARVDLDLKVKEKEIASGLKIEEQDPLDEIFIKKQKGEELI